MGIKTLSQLDPQNAQVILRCDLNVPIKDGVITDDGRIRASLATINKLLAGNCSIVILAHLGRPKGERKIELSLDPIAKRLGELLKIEVKFSSAITGVASQARALKSGEVMLLENIRFESAETSKDESERSVLAAELATYGDIYIGDGFGAVHRKHASVYELAKLLPNAAGDLVCAEVDVLERLTKNPDRPYAVVLGGAKVSDKIAVISNLLEKVNVIAVGGGMVFTFLAAQGKQIGKSLVEPELIPTVRELLLRAEKLGIKFLLPIDTVVAPEFSFSSFAGKEVSLAWNGVKDPGSGLCQTNLIDEDGLVTQSSEAKNSPVIKVQNGVTLNSKAQAFDCIGNGVVGDLSVTNTFVSADKSSKTGKWSPAGAAYPAGSIKCVGKCTLSMSAQGSVDVLVGSGASTVTVSNKVVATIADSKAAKLRVGARVEIGKTKKVIRLTGSNFVAVGANTASATFTNEKLLARTPAEVDDSLEDSKQLALSKFGFNVNDFSQEWVVLPMPGGTTTNDPTLDLCGGTFASEKDRLERRQMSVYKQGTPFSFLSTEVVRYSSAAAASAAHKELVKVLAQCQSEKGYKNATGAITPYAFKPLPPLPAGLVAENSRVLVDTVIDTGDAARHLLGFYQFNGEMFTGLYVISASPAGFSDAQVAKWLKVAVTMAERLTKK